MILGDLGADIVKIERPGAGDDTRGWGPPFDPRGESAYFLAVNRNKVSVAADLGRREDLALLKRLAAGADAVVENFLPGTLERRGFAADELLAAHPRLIWCSITGFGAASPRPGYDLVVQAESGWMSITGDADGDPMKHGIALVDVLAGKDAAIAVLAALVARSSGAPRSIADRKLVVSLAQSAAAALVNVAQSALVTGLDARRWGNAHANLVPYQLLHAADRPFVLAVGNDSQFAASAGALGLEELARDPQYTTNAGRVEARERLIATIAARVRTAPAAHWIAALDAVGVPCGLVRTVLEALGEAAASPLTGVSPLAPATIRRPPPRLDEHGALVRSKGWGAFD
jgi:crotonobetainyl-CoA:carnitine CoA-transferase CaiB-like acyl-CoA transferase